MYCDLWPYVWLINESGFKSRAAYGGARTVLEKETNLYFTTKIKKTGKNSNVCIIKGVTCPNVSTTHITAMGCWQCLPLSVVQLKGKHCRNLHCRNGVVNTFGPYHIMLMLL